ncbi:MAG: leucyl aminopeptidase [Phycisphaera sp.]|nr:leucyl aminopeptidase [Phycisphaera sp.]
MYKRIKVSNSKSNPDAIAVAVSSDAKRTPAALRDVDKRLGGAIGDSLKRGEFSADAGSVSTFYPTTGAERLYVIGLGDVGKPVGGSTLNAWRIGAARLTGAADRAGIGSIALHLDGGKDAVEIARAVGEGLGLGAFVYDELKGTASGNGVKKGPTTLDVATDSAATRKAMERGLTIAESANVARRLAATPPNIANPAYLVSEAKKIARQTGLTCKVIDGKRAKAMGMGGLTAVGQAGSTPPAMIMLEHTPRGTAKDAPVMLVGKAITFDTGGYSLKVGGTMVNMKYDKCGGMAVLGAMHAVARLKLPVRVVGIIAAAENMVDTGAYRVDDVITAYNGVTIEITNTDAEGRLVLADALSYGCKTYKPRAVVDLATLTGGVVTALGPYCAGCFVNDDKLRKSLFDAGEATGERLWRLPLWEEHRKQMKGTHGDIANSAGRNAHPIQGAAFLSYFVAKDGDFKTNADVPWAHLDIAGVADVAESSDWSGLFSKGPTGFGVRLLVRALEQWK